MFKTIVIPKDLIRVTILLKDMRDFETVNFIYEKFMDREINAADHKKGTNGNSSNGNENGKISQMPARVAYQVMNR